MKTRRTDFSQVRRRLVKRFAVFLRDGLLLLHSSVKGREKRRTDEVKSSRTMTVCVVGDTETYAPGSRKDTLRDAFDADRLYSHNDNGSMRRCECTVLHYLRDTSIMKRQIAALFYSIAGIQRLYFVETSFISGILGVTHETNIPDKYKKVYSYIIDDMGFYFDSLSISRTEQYINSDELVLSRKEKERCSQLIRIIVENKITKYNFQPLSAPDCMKREGRKVLVVDQTFADASVRRGRGDAASFKRMLADALEENPGATVLVKSHPDLHLQKKQCYYESIADSVPEDARIVLITAPVNPYSLLEGVDLVYTCTSQLGFEALLAGKRVKTYGMPIYAGWGLTEDALFCPRRKRKRSVEELFYALYIAFAVHIDPFTSRRCSLEQYLESLPRLRTMYFASASSEQYGNDAMRGSAGFPDRTASVSNKAVYH